MIARAQPSAIGEFEAITIENGLVRLVVLPALGGRVWSLEDIVRRRQWVWQREGVPLRRSPVGSNYDDVWAGGWEELFPNDAPGRFEGRDLPDHGEWWATVWEPELSYEGTAVVLRLHARLSTIAVDCTKVFRLDAGSSTLQVAYDVQSLERKPFHFMFKQHLPISINSSCRLMLPGGECKSVDTRFGSSLQKDEWFDWPAPSWADVDLRVVPERSECVQEFVYVRDLPRPWCGVEDRHAGASIRMDFPQHDFPYVWLFLSYGGWRDVYTAVLEPCSNLPKDLSEAAHAGRSAVLYPGQRFSTKVMVTLSGRE